MSGETHVSNPPPPTKSIQELNLEDSDEITLYLELIRIIERDIDDIQAGDTRNGWTSWAMAAGVGAGVLALFSETRKLALFPTIPVEIISLTGVLIYNVVVLGMKMLSFDQLDIRPGKVRWSNEAYVSFAPSAIFSLIILIASIVIAAFIPLPFVPRILALVAFGLWTLGTLMVLVLARIPFPLGNTKTTKKSGLIIGAITFLTSLAASGALITQLARPIGEDATLPYILAGLILVVLLLLGNLVFRLAPSRLLSNLKDLRNEIIFLRLDVDEALKRYELLSEGESFPDAIQKELSEVLGDLNVVEYAHWNMHRLIEQMMQKLPRQQESTSVREKKIADINLDKDSYLLHDQRCSQILSSIGIKITALINKMKRVIVATQDWGTDNMVRASLTQRLQLTQQVEAQLRQRREAIEYYLANPDKIPAIPALKVDAQSAASDPGKQPPPDSPQPEPPPEKN